MKKDKNMYYLINLSTPVSKKVYKLFTIFILTSILTAFQSSAFAKVLFQDDFESGNKSKTQNGVKWASGVNTTVNTIKPRTGSYAMEFNFKAAVDGKDSFSEQRFALNGNYPEVWIQYDLYIPTNYYHRRQTSSANNKSFVHLWTENYKQKEGIAGGFEIWPNGSGVGRLKFNPARPINSHYEDTRSENGIDLSDKGKWITITIQVKAGTASSTEFLHGSEVRAWKSVNGGSTKLIYKLTDVVFKAWNNTDTILFNKNGKNYFNNGYILGWANSGFAQTTKLYMDNVTIATTPLISLDPPKAPVPTP